MSLAGKISVGYFCVGVLYIAVSDVILSLYHDPGFNEGLAAVSASILKGWFFFLVSGIVLYVVLKRFAKRLQDQRHLLNTVVNNTHDWLWLVDNRCQVLMANRSFLNIFVNDTQADLIGRNPLELARNNEERDKWKDYYERALAGEEIHVTEDQLGFENENVHMEFHFYPVVNRKGKVEMVTCFGHDITGLKSVQKEIENQNRALKEITWIQAHEMRKPVANIQGLIEALDTENPTSKENWELMEHVRNQTDELDRVIRKIVARASAVK